MYTINYWMSSSPTCEFIMVQGTLCKCPSLCMITMGDDNYYIYIYMRKAN